MPTDRVPTGIPGFDKLIQGGLVKGSTNLVAGGTGSGKSIFGMQFIYNGVTKYKENGLFISFEEATDFLKKDARIFGWDFNELEKKKKCKFLYLSPYTTTDLQSSLMEDIPKNRNKRVVIDSISVFAMALNDSYRIRKQIFMLMNTLQDLGITSVLTSETLGEAPIDISSPSRDGSFSRYGVEEFVADSVITLHNSGLGGSGDRAVRVVKMRRTNHVKGPVAMDITSKGLKVLGKEKSYKL
jgi:circadian clock protein KaiC